MLKNYIMLQKVRFRLVFNRARRLNRQGEGLVQIECSQGGRRIYISTHVYVKPDCWNAGLVTDHPLSQGLNAALMQMLIEAETIELEYVRRGVYPTLPMIRDALREHTSPAARLRDFITEVINSSDRKEHTKEGYMTLRNNLERFRKGSLVSDIDHQFIVKYEAWLRQEGLMHNTRVGRLRMLRAVMNEAVAREIIAKNPFDRYQIPQMTPKRGFIPAEKLRKLEKMKVAGKKEELVRDAFLFCCYTGLRFSDMVTLRSTHISDDGWIKKRMVKTGFVVEVPMKELFGGAALDIVRKYGTIERLSTKIGQNGTVNQVLHRLLSAVGIDEDYTFHTARHTFAQLLLHQGIPMTAIQQMLGHRKLETTQIYGERDRVTLLAEMRKSMNSKSKAK